VNTEKRRSTPMQCAWQRRDRARRRVERDAQKLVRYLYGTEDWNDVDAQLVDQLSADLIRLKLAHKEYARIVEGKVA